MILYFLYKTINKLINYISHFWNHVCTWWIMKGNNIQFCQYKTNGVPYIMIARGGKCYIGKNFIMNNGVKGNPIGCYQKCTIFVDREGELVIGDNVRISQTALICTKKITIENCVKIGGGVCIYDTDFHSLDPILRNSAEDIKFRKTKAILIKENAFIGAHSIILKGVTIGKNSIVGAGSVVTKSIPDNQIWAGNPARFIKNINE